jgi:DNA-directed RNA polymerase subunit alpha
LDANRTLEQTRIEVMRDTERYARIVITPLDGGYGTTLGNALRRVMLSSLEGAAVTSVKVADVYHEFSTIPNAREDTMRLMLNLKLVRFRPLSEESEAEWRLSLMASGEGLVTAADIVLPPDLEIMNPEQPLLKLDSHDADVQLELMVRSGSGYSPAEERGKLAIGELPVDAIFSPVRRVSFNVTKTRVGQLADYDSLTMDIWTDGTLTPSDALSQASAILAERFAFLAVYGEEVPEVDEAEGDGIPMPIYETAIEELDLSVRAYNCLKRAGLSRVGEILERMAQGDEEMLVIRNFGQKSLDELKEALRLKGFDEYLEPTTVAEETESEPDGDSEEDSPEDEGE